MKKRLSTIKRMKRSRLSVTDRLTSRLLLVRNLGFPLVNFSFAVTLGIVYWIAALLLTAALGGAAPNPADWEWARTTALSALYSPAFWALYAALAVALWVYSDAKDPVNRWALAYVQTQTERYDLCLVAVDCSSLKFFQPWRFQLSILPSTGV